ncbi:MAG: hypothetical protein J0M04_11515 [Verrucomicrobia bacterium]|nr:hypothetical protein [Verrucomicrobiota bacterium]
MRYFKIAILALLAINALVAAAEPESDATISWRFEGIGEVQRRISSTLAVPIIRYYWNDQFVGEERNGLAEIYDRLESFKGKSVLFIARPRKEKDPGYIEGPKPIINPLEDHDAFHHIYALLRKKSLRFTIEFQDDAREPQVRSSGSNPFREPRNGSADLPDTGHPATAPESKPEGGDKPQPKSEGRSR